MRTKRHHKGPRTSTAWLRLSGTTFGSVSGTPLETLTREPGFVGTVSPSRPAVLRVVALKAYEQDGVFGILPEMSAAPAWVGRGDLVAIKIKVFASMVPREALVTLVEKDFRALLAKARAAGPDNPAQA